MAASRSKAYSAYELGPLHEGKQEVTSLGAFSTLGAAKAAADLTDGFGLTPDSRGGLARRRRRLVARRNILHRRMTSVANGE